VAANFWKLDHPTERLAVVDVHGGRKRTYGELRADVEREASAMRPEPAAGTAKPSGKSLIMLLAQNRYENLVAYLAALNSGDAVVLVDATLNRDLLLRLIETYRPDRICESTASAENTFPGYSKREGGELGICIWENEKSEATAIHESLALLLNTSGSTGSPKLVRLSGENLQANASSIASYLGLTAEERPITSLPMAYSYGLSVINSHLLAGATLVLSEHGVLRREFWDSVDKYGCTSIAGVPYTYQMLLQTGLLKKRGATLRTVTQAGGALAEPFVRQMHDLAAGRGFKFFVMYGQTEATARISYLPFENLAAKVGSIGVAIPNGSLRVDAETGELIYSGPNVMMGYAESRDDLSKDDELRGVLKTGDLARQDADGFFYVTGRMKRFLKMFGKRFNLDEVEQIVQRRFGFPTACFGRDDLLMVAFEAGSENADAVIAMLSETFGVPKNAVRVEAVGELPRTIRGKIDYQALATRNQSEVAASRVR
jgi:acyl-CoA synthetase (AMP-forming)/AMP-acid ligase II